jgi:hypothetical protein
MAMEVTEDQIEIQRRYQIVFSHLAPVLGFLEQVSSALLALSIGHFLNNHISISLINMFSGHFEFSFRCVVLSVVMFVRGL